MKVSKTAGPQDKVTAHTLRTLIAKRSHVCDNARRVALFFELRNGTGFSQRKESYVDAFSIHTWPSKGLTRTAYEIKTSRADFLRELDSPMKRSWAMEISNEFWFVCANGVVKENEIPEGCGLLVATKGGGQLRRVVHAKHREARDLRMVEVAAIARQSCQHDAFKSLRWFLAGKELTTDDLDALIDDQRDASDKRVIETEVDKQFAAVMKNLQEGLSNYAGALKASGVTPPAWMTDGSLSRNMCGIGGTTRWSADDWVARNVVPGPSRHAVKCAMDNVAHAKSSISAIEKHLAHMLALPSCEESRAEKAA